MPLQNKGVENMRNTEYLIKPVIEHMQTHLDMDGKYTHGNITYFYSNMMSNKLDYGLNIPKRKNDIVYIYEIASFDIKNMFCQKGLYQLFIKEKDNYIKNTFQFHQFRVVDYFKESIWYYNANKSEPSQKLYTKIKNFLDSDNDEQVFHDYKNKIHSYIKKFENCYLTIQINKSNHVGELPIFYINYFLITPFFTLKLTENEVWKMFKFDKRIKEIVFNTVARPNYRNKEIVSYLLGNDKSYFLDPINVCQERKTYFKNMRDKKCVTYVDNKLCKDEIAELMNDFIYATCRGKTMEKLIEPLDSFKDYSKYENDLGAVVETRNFNYYFLNTQFGMMPLKFLYSKIFDYEDFNEEKVNKYDNIIKQLEVMYEKRKKLEKILMEK